MKRSDDPDTGPVRILERRVEWLHDPWDDPDATDALVVERSRRSRRKVKTIVFTFGAVLIVAVVVVGAVGLWYLGRVNPSGAPGAPVNFTVAKTDTIQTISERLERDGLVSSAGVFRWYVAHHDGLTLTPGYYQLRPRDHMGNVMRALKTPPAETFTNVTFPEGFTLARMATRLSTTVPRLSAADFLAAANSAEVPSALRPPGVTSLEGLLFPDTYQVSNGESAGQLVDRMAALMERVGKQENIDGKGAAMYLTPYQVLIVASMIEREAKFDDDRAKIARVIFNRLALNMPLAIDATLSYGQAHGLSFPELQALDTPYNTYLHPGLPPTPIANPGRASIHAALNPAADPTQGDPICVGLPKQTPCRYLYYVLANEDGHHAFSATAEQQQANIDKAKAAGIL